MPMTVSEMASKGGKARWAGVSKKARSKAMKKAIRARWEKGKRKKAEKAQ